MPRCVPASRRLRVSPSLLPRARAFLRQSVLRSALLCASALHAQGTTYSALQYGDPRNGNVYVTFLDLELKGGAAPRIFRSYQSLSAHCGLFGCGWSSDYETYLAVEGDGSVVAHEFGGGATSAYRAASASAHSIDAMVEQIAGVARGSGVVSADSLIAYQSLLRDNVSFRATEWKRFVKAGRLVPPVIPVGTQLRAITPYGVDEMTRTTNGYERRLADGTRQYFDGQGRLTRTEASGHWLEVARDPRGRISTVRDDSARTLRFTLDPNGRVSRVDGSKGRYAAFRYDARGDLVWTRDGDGVVITHAYDGWHYLTRIGRANGTSVRIDYYPLSMNARVRRVTDEAGITAEYGYRWTRADSLEYVVDVTVLGPAKGQAVRRDTLSRRQHVYEERRRADGARWMARIAETIDGRTEATFYDEECSVPVRLVSGADTTVRTLDARCRGVTLSNARTTDTLAYDDNDRVVFAAQGPRGGTPRPGTRFAYDGEGRLTTAESLAGVTRLEYDAASRLVRVTGDDGVLTVTRDSAGRPTVIGHSVHGALNVSYGADGKPTTSPAPGTNLGALQAFKLRLQRLVGATGFKLDF